MTTTEYINYPEHAVIGPPGCGKTTWLANEIRKAVEQGDTVSVTSLTRAAAHEVAGRDLPIPEEQIGTLHSHCARSLSGPNIAQDKHWIAVWNTEYPNMALTPGANTANHINGDAFDQSSDSDGDQLMAEYQTARAHMQTENLSEPAQAFAEAWEDFKRQNDLVDYTDLIQLALENVPTAPGSPDVMMVDEAQDLNLLEITLIRKWAAQAGTMIAVGDPDQAIYQWRGADPFAFTRNLRNEVKRRILSQSYRVPRKIHRFAMDWINRIENRQPVKYEPTQVEGEIRCISGTYETPDTIMDDIETYIARDKTVMILTSCGYMLEPMLELLKEQAWPFANPHRRSNGAWNPMPQRRGSISTAARLLSFIRLQEEGLWTAQDVKQWTDLITAKDNINHGSKTLIPQLQNEAEDSGISWEDIYRIFPETTVEAALTGDLTWLDQRLTAKYHRTARFPLDILQKRGPDVLRKPPLIQPGTIHSVKGAEADVVYIFPDISHAASEEWNGDYDRQAAIYRLFYVGITRARETLVICQPASANNVPLHT